MAVFRAARLLDQIGREHLQLCVTLVADTPELMQATAAAARSLPAADIRRASSTKENAATLLYAPLEALLRGSTPGPAASYVFHASIFAAAVHAEADELLAEMAGESAADDLTLMLLIALESEDYEFILQGAATDILDKFGDMLGQTYYKVQASGFCLSAIMGRHGHRSSALENLDIETELEAHRIEMRQLLPAARTECAGDENRSQMLDTLEGMLEAKRIVPPAPERHTAEDQETDAPGSPEKIFPQEGTAGADDPPEPIPPAAPTGMPLDGLELSEMVLDAFSHAASGLRPGEPLDTRRLFIALEAFDLSSQWDRLWLETGDTEFLASLKLEDPEPDPGGRWNTVPLTGTCTRSLHVAVRLCDARGLWPMPIGALALALIADPWSSAARAVMAGGNLDHTDLIRLLQEITFGTDLGNVEQLLTRQS